MHKMPNNFTTAEKGINESKDPFYSILIREAGVFKSRH